MSLKSILIVVLLAAVFIVLISWISRMGGWQNGGCNGNCSSCQSRCESKQADTKNDSTPDEPQD